MSPHKRAQRLRSRTAYRDLSKTQAIAAASAQPNIADPLWPPPALGRGQTITRFLSDNSAMVSGPGGRGVALSTTPLAVDDEHGHKVPVDVTLTDQGNSYRPVRAAVPISIGKSIGDGATLGPIGVTLADASPKATPSLVGGKVFYANASTDTDYFVAPLPDAIEAGWMLRSPAAPENETLSLELPAGAELRASGDAAEVRQDGKLIATIPPPAAWDADGTPVPASYSVVGDQLSVHVAHRGADVRYPVEVDPLVGMVFGNDPNGNPGNFPGWGFHWTDPWGVPLRPGTATVPQKVDLYPGNNYANTSEGWWQFDAAGSSYVYEWDLSSFSHSSGIGLSSAIIGIFNSRDVDTSSVTGGGWYAANGNSGPQPESIESDFSGATRRVCTTYTGTNGTNGPPCQATTNGNPTGNNVRLKLELGKDICCLASDGEYVSQTGAVLLIGDDALPDPPTMPTLPTGWVESLPSVDVAAHENGAGISQVKVAIPDAGSSDSKNIQCTSTTTSPYNSTASPYTPCPQTPTPTPTVAISKSVPEGVHAVNASAVSATGLTGPTTSKNVKIDRSPPTTPDLSDSLYDKRDTTLSSGSYNLHMHATDGDPNGGNAAARSGMRNFALEVDDATGKAVTNWTDANQQCPAGSCAMDDDWQFHVVDYTPGVYTIKVSAYDQMGHQSAAASFTVIVGAPPVGSADQLGLEDYFQYQSVETGAGSRAHVNLADGNLVWHSVPLVNPGRGLSTFVNLTYNSQSQVATPVLPYSQAGIGFSLGVSGITRVNDPLDLSEPNAVTLTDLDGTRHRFVSSDGETYAPPPGVNLHLRRFSAGVPGALQDPTKAWAATRPDGVTFYFDEAGYETFVVDRNGNQLKFNYDYYTASGGICDTADQLKLNDVSETPLCPHRLHTVQDATANAGDTTSRAVTFTYDADPTVDASGALDLGHVKDITDHAGRMTELHYTADGYLDMVTEAKGQPAERSFHLNYLDADPNCPTQPRYLNDIQDPRGAHTQITYDACSSVTSPPHRVLTLTDRNNKGVTNFDYRGVPGSTCAQDTCVKDALGHTTEYTLDSRGRLVRMQDARNAVTKVQWDDASGNACGTSYDNNNVCQITEAAGTTDQAVTSMSYNQNGLLLRETNPDGNTTTFGYEDSPGTQVSGQTTPGTSSSIDSGGTFVSDLVSNTLPRGNVAGAAPGSFTYNFTLDNNDQSHKGNVTDESDPTGATAHTGYDANGQITSETDLHRGSESVNTTTYSNYDPSGFPQTRVDARGNQWLFCYDDAGNLIRLVDPRGDTSYTTCPSNTPSPPSADSPFMTTLTYDALDHLVAEQRPKDSKAGIFVTRGYDYDHNDNLTSFTDGNGKQWDRTYTAMDDPFDVSSPAVSDVGDSAPAAEVTRYAYDAVENVTDVTFPNGTATSLTGDYSTHYDYDAVNEVIESTQQSRTPDKDLVTSYAYDLRGNLIGLADPNRNPPGSDPVADAQDPSKRRFTYQYDAANQRTDAIEDPGGLALKTHTEYDADKNVTKVTDPRGFQSGNTAAAYTTTYGYDDRDQLTSITDPMGAKTQWVLRGDGRPASKTMPNGTAGCDPSSASCDYTTTYQYFPTGELQSFTLPRAPNQYGQAGKFTFTRDALGNPTGFTDPRAQAPHSDPQTYTFTSEFYDTGELKSTDAPWFWQLGISGTGPSAPTAATGPGPPSPGGPQLDEPTPQALLAREVDPSVASAQVGADGSGNPPDGQPASSGAPPDGGTGDFGSVGQKQLPDLLPDASHPNPNDPGKPDSTTFAYDGDMQLTGVTRPDGSSIDLHYDEAHRLKDVVYPFDTESNPSTSITTTFGYDRNGNLASYTDGNSNRAVSTTFDHDQFDRLTAINAPAPSDSASDRSTTTLGYDDNGNRTSVETPRGLTWIYGFDALDRKTSVKDPTNDLTTYGAFDGAGNPTLVTSPRGNALAAGDKNLPKYQTTYAYDADNRVKTETDGLGNKICYGYDHDGNTTSVDAPGATTSAPNCGDAGRQVTLRTYDGRDLPWTTTVGSAANQRTDVTEYDGVGNLRRAVSPAGVGSDHLPLLHDDAALSTNPQSQSDQSDTALKDATRNATVYEYDRWNVATAIHLPFGRQSLSDTTSSDDPARYREDLSSDLLGRPTSISSPYDWTRGQTASDHTTYHYFATGWIRDVTDHPVDPPDAARTEYSYDPQGDETRWCTEASTVAPPGCGDPGSSESTARRIVDRTYFLNGELEQRKARSSFNDSSPRTYNYTYDANGNMNQMADVQLGRTTDFSWDDADRNLRVNEAGSSGKDTVLAYDKDGNVQYRKTDGAYDPATQNYTGGKTTTFSYDPVDRESSLLVAVPKPGSNRSMTTDYWPSGQVERQTQLDASNKLRVKDEYSYNDDAMLAKKVRTTSTGLATTRNYTYDPDGNRTQDERGTYTFNSRDQLVSWTRPGGTKQTATYTLNGSGAVTKKSDLGQTTTYNYADGNTSDRLASVSTTGSATTATYCYGATGQVTLITTSSCPTTSTDQNCGKPVTASSDYAYCYDEFGRLTRSDDPGDKNGTTYTYDGFDRRDSRCVLGTSADCSDGTLDTFSYVGMSEQLSRESQKAGTTTTVRSYDYDASLNRIGFDSQVGTGTPAYRSYAKDATGSVEALQGADGNIPTGESYQYDPYGELTNATSLDGTANGNPFRFEDFFYDSGVKSYDMQARPYRPDVGHFLTADRFEDSTGDYNLEADPLTQNRYAFAGGNPINRIEFDGHRPDLYVNNAECRCSNTTGRSVHRQHIGGSNLQAPASQHLIKHRARVAQTQAIVRNTVHAVAKTSRQLMHGLNPLDPNYMANVDYSAGSFPPSMTTKLPQPIESVGRAIFGDPGRNPSDAFSDAFLFVPGLDGEALFARAVSGSAKADKAAEAAKAADLGEAGRTTVLGENMKDRVIPYAERTGGQPLDLVAPEEWERMTPRERWKANDSALRRRIRAGDSFAYLGRDPDRPGWLRRKFDLTGSELLRLTDRGIPFEIVPRSHVRQVIGRP